MLALTSCGGGGSGGGGGGGGGTPPPPPAATCTVLYTSPLGATQSAPKLLVDNDNVYWSEASSAGNISIKSIPKGGGIVETLASGQSVVGLQDFTIDQINLYWVTSGEDGANDGENGISQVYRVPLAGGSASLFASAPLVNDGYGGETSGITPYGVGGSVYWDGGGTMSSSGIGGTETVFSFPALNGPYADAGTLVVLNSGNIVTRVYSEFNTNTNFPPYLGTGYVEIDPIQPNPTAEFLTPLIGNDQGDLITDGVDVYGLAAQGTSPGHSVFKISGASATVLAQASGTALSVATDDTYLYYAGGGEAGIPAVSAYAIAGGKITSSQCVTSDGTYFSISLVGVHGLYLDESYIYVMESIGNTNTGSYHILQMKKP